MVHIPCSKKPFLQCFLCFFRYVHNPDLVLLSLPSHSSQYLPCESACLLTHSLSILAYGKVVVTLIKANGGGGEDSELLFEKIAETLGVRNVAQN